MTMANRILRNRFFMLFLQKWAEKNRAPGSMAFGFTAFFFDLFWKLKKRVYSRIPLGRCNLGYSGLSYMDVVLRPLEDAVLVDIPRLHAVCSRRTGVEQVNDLICAPWPEHSRVQSIVNTQIDLYLWGPTWVGHGRTVLPCLWIIPNGVIKRVKHSSGLIEISHEKVLMIIDGIIPGL